MSEKNNKEDKKPLIDENEIVSVERSSLNDSNEENNNTTDSSDDNEEKKLIEKYPEFILEENTQKYVITINGIPQCYTQTLEKARNCMWNLARLEKINYTEYQCFIQEMDNPNDIQVIGYHRFSIISYNRTLVNLSVRSVLEIAEKPEKSIYMEEKSKPTMIERILGYN